MGKLWVQMVRLWWAVLQGSPQRPFNLCVTSRGPRLSASVSPFVAGAVNLGRSVLLIPHTPLCDFGRVCSLFCVSIWSLRGHSWGALGHCGEAS